MSFNYYEMEQQLEDQILDMQLSISLLEKKLKEKSTSIDLLDIRAKIKINKATKEALENQLQNLRKYCKEV